VVVVVHHAFVALVVLGVHQARVDIILESVESSFVQGVDICAVSNNTYLRVSTTQGGG
jgi:hypothetical protein